MPLARPTALSMRAVLLLCLGVAAASGLLGACVGYWHAKASYEAVGFNNGSITARTEILARIRQHLRPPRCTSLRSAAGLVEIISVKSDALSLGQSENGTPVWCVW